MNPYRERTPTWTPPAAKKKSQMALVGPAIIIVSLAAGGNLAEMNPRFLLVLPFGFLLGILVIVLEQRRRTPMMRLSRLTWNRGDRFGATMLFLGIGAPKLSPKRIARNRAAVAVMVEKCRRDRRWPLARRSS